MAYLLHIFVYCQGTFIQVTASKRVLLADPFFCMKFDIKNTYGTKRKKGSKHNSPYDAVTGMNVPWIWLNLRITLVCLRHIKIIQIAIELIKLIQKDLLDMFS